MNGCRYLPPQPVEVLRATVRLFPAFFCSAIFCTVLGPTLFDIEHLDYGTTLDATDYALPVPPGNEIVVSQPPSRGSDPDRVWASVLQSVQQVADQGLPSFQYRFVRYLSESVGLGGSGGQHPPELVVEYRLR